MEISIGLWHPKLLKKKTFPHAITFHCKAFCNLSLPLPFQPHLELCHFPSGTYMQLWHFSFWSMGKCCFFNNLNLCEQTLFFSLWYVPLFGNVMVAALPSPPHNPLFCSLTYVHPSLTCSSVHSRPRLPQFLIHCLPTIMCY